jgi:hypothetical protein
VVEAEAHCYDRLPSAFRLTLRIMDLPPSAKDQPPITLPILIYITFLAWFHGYSTQRLLRIILFPDKNVPSFANTTLRR